ncbi:MAG TPA: dihydroxy-acid dehydratase [Kofleriaceae bacterium]|jgi:dihydroxy-acid dehydratase|nr:dihydroxy-acid dehydratase [Kofleriaceae bacterium]
MSSDRNKLHSQHLRTINFQGDALRMGMNWTEEDLAKPQILLDSAYGMGHPGTFHFRPLIEEISNGVFEAGGKPGVFYVSDICDGVAQATSGMSYSLVSRDVMAAMVEIHALGHPHDGMVLLSGNDKSVPAHLSAIARCKLPAIHVPGGTQFNAPDYFTSNKLWPFGMEVDRGRKTHEELFERQKNACPTCGACQFMGSASTGQVLSEALGLALPGSALIPMPLSMLLRYARAAGKRIVELVRLGLTPDKILTREAFENAVAVHAAVGGSTNALLHLPAMAHEIGIDLTIDDFDRIHRRVPVLANVKTTGKYPVEYFYYAGGVPKVMMEISDLLHLDCMTVTGKTVGDNLEDIRRSYFFEERLGYLRNYRIEPTEIIRTRAEPFGTQGGIAILRGNIAPDGAVIKAFTVPVEMHVHTGPARVFDGEQACLEALRRSAIKSGDVMVIRYEGPRANGMPEMYFASAVLSADPVLGRTTALITDGRYSGAMQGPSIGHVSPEAADGGPIALVEDGDLIEINIPERKLAMVGIHGRRAADDEIARVLAERRAHWTPMPSRHHTGILGLFSRVATEAARGGELTPPHGAGSLPAKQAAAAPRGDGNGRRAERSGPARSSSPALRGGPVVIADHDFGDVDLERAIIERAGFDLVAAQCKSEGDVIAAARDAVGVITQYARVGARAVEAFTRCQVIARYGTGVDIVDVDAATRRGIQVTNAPNDWCADEVADHAIALWLAAVRKITQYDAATRRGEWQWQTGQPIHRMRGRVFGLLSFGAIARGIAERARPFGVELWVHDPFIDQDDIHRQGARPVSFDELVRGSDYLVIQAPLTPDTRALFDDKVLRKMKPTAILVNTARGPIVVDAALQRALEDGWIAAAALDDLEEEPAKRLDWQSTNPLFRLDNAIITPHAAYYSEEAVRSVREIAASEVVRVLTGRPPLSPVNFVDAELRP